MGLATTHASAELGIDAPPITVEVEVSPGLPQTRIVGLPETAVRESKDRVKAAMTSSGFSYPSKRITVNLAPADMPKQGGRYDLAIAIAILAASDQLAGANVKDIELLGELSLTGSLRAVSGVLPAALRPDPSRRWLIVPLENAREAAIAEAEQIVAAATLRDVVAHLTGQTLLPSPPSTQPQGASAAPLHLGDIHGQRAAKRALTIAAAGGHNLLMIGPPGTGKTMLANRLLGLLPPMTREQALEVASVTSVSNQAFDPADWGRRPFRSPHHTASAVAIVGGSSPPRPGEISLAHNGVLFLDELPEFSRHVLEVLREPLESGEIFISRATARVRYPARFQLVAAMNPCPCGHAGDNLATCECSPERIHRYRSKVSGPLLDRIDLHVEVPALPKGVLTQSMTNEDIKAREEHEKCAALVNKTRDRMLSRQGASNSQLGPRSVRRWCHLALADREFLDDAVSRLGVSARGFYKVLKVARTIADLAGEDEVQRVHLTESLGYRKLDRNWD